MPLQRTFVSQSYLILAVLLWGGGCDTQFTDEKVQTQRRKVTFLRSQDKVATSGSPAPQATVLCLSLGVTWGYSGLYWTEGIAEVSPNYHCTFYAGFFS